MPRLDKKGNLEFHPSELPNDYLSNIDPENPFFNKQVKIIISITRSCRICKTKFVLHCEYDPTNPAHDLCDDCLLKQPRDSGQKYPEKTIQIDMEAGEVYYNNKGE